MSYIVLSVLISTKHSVEEATDWIRGHGFIARKVHSTKKFHRFRQHTTKYAQDRGFDTVRTAKLGKNKDMEIIIAYKKEDEPDLKLGGSIIDLARTVIYGRKTYAPAHQKIIEDYGLNTITSIKVGRKPLSSVLNAVLNVVSLGIYKKWIQSSEYDSLFHLFALISLNNGKTILIEKRASIDMVVIKKNYTPPAYTEFAQVVIEHPDIQFKTLLDNTEKLQGKNYFIYNAETNNCQKFISDMLKSNGLLTPELNTFINQDVTSLFDKLKYSKGLINATTGLGTTIDILSKGGLRKKDIENVSQVEIK
jgi:hypothetical protein